MLKPGYWAVTFLGLIRGEIDLRGGEIRLLCGKVNGRKACKSIFLREFGGKRDFKAKKRRFVWIGNQSFASYADQSKTLLDDTLKMIENIV